jgi:hypothetical protein
MISLSGCGSGEPASPAAEAPTTTSAGPSQTLASTTTTIPLMALAPEILGLKQNSLAKVTSLKYIDNNGNAIYIKGTKAKIVLLETVGTKDRIYDTIFLDIANKKAYSSCIKTSCSTEIKMKYWPADYNLYKVDMNPVFFIQDVASGALDKSQTRNIDSFSTTLLSFTGSSGTQGTMWVSNFYGIPLEVNEGGVKILFKSLQVNSLTDNDVNMPSGYTEMQA